MAIETKDLVLYKSERLTDTDDGGGKYSGQVIVDGQSNNLFNDVSEMDRTMGDVSMRKIFPAVITERYRRISRAQRYSSLKTRRIQTCRLYYSVPKTGQMNAVVPKTV